MQTSRSNSLDVILFKGERGEGREKFVYFKSSLLCHGWRVILRLQLCSQFIFHLNYGNDVKIWLLKLFFKKN